MEEVLKVLFEMQKQINGMQSDMREVKSSVLNLESHVTDLKNDMSEVKESLSRIETSQNDDVVAMLHTINDKVKITDKVVDLHSILLHRMQAQMEMPN